MDVIKRLEMSPRCLKGLVGESGAGKSLQTLTFSDAAETRLTSLAQCTNPNWILHSKNMDLECNNIHTCSPLTAHFNNLCCVFTRHWPTALRAERGNLLVLLEVIKYLLRFAHLHFSFALECVSSNPQFHFRQTNSVTTFCSNNLLGNISQLTSLTFAENWLTHWGVRSSNAPNLSKWLWHSCDVSVTVQPFLTLSSASQLLLHRKASRVSAGMYKFILPRSFHHSMRLSHAVFLSHFPPGLLICDGWAVTLISYLMFVFQKQCHGKC